MSLAGGVGPLAWARARAQWSPLNVTSANLVAWYDVTLARTTAAGVVSALQDLSGNGRHLAAAGGSPDLVSFRNGLEGVQATGTERLVGAFGASFGTAEIYTFGTWADSTSAATYYDGDDIANRNALYHTSTPPKVSMYDGTISTSTITAPFSRPFVSRARHNGSSSRIRIEASGELVVDSTMANTGPNSLDGVCVINNYLGSAPWLNGCLSGMFVFDGPLSTEEDALLMQWIRDRTALQLVWEPSAISSSTLLYWFKADQGITITSGAVSAWNDLSGNGNHLAQGTSGARPALNYSYRNGLPAVVCDGTDDRLFRNALTQGSLSPNPRRHYVVYRYPSAVRAAVVGLVSSIDTVFTVYLHQSNGRPALYNAAIGSGMYTPSLPSLDSFNLVSTRTVAAVGESFVKNLQDGGSWQSTTGTVGTASIAGVNIGSYHTAAGSYFGGGIMEVLATNSDDAGLDTQIEAYLQARWNIQPA